MAANESLIKIEIRGSPQSASTGGSGGSPTAPPSQPVTQQQTQQEQAKRDQQESQRRERPEPLRRSPKDEGNSESDGKPGVVAQVIGILIRGQIVRQIRHLTGLFTGEQSLARIVTQSAAFGDLIVKAGDKLANVVQATFGNGGGEWVRNMGREVAASVSGRWKQSGDRDSQNAGARVRAMMSDNETEKPGDKKSGEKKDDILDVIDVSKTANKVSGQNAQSAESPNMLRATAKASTASEVEGLPSVTAATEGTTAGAGGAMGGLGGTAAVGAGAIAGAVIANELIGKAGGVVADAISGVGSTLAAVASTKILPLDRMFASALRETGEVVSHVSGLAGAVIQIAGGIVEATVKVKDALLQRAEELGAYSGALTVANVNRGLADFRGDLNEANQLGPKLARLVESQTQVEIIGREMSTNFKEVMLDIIVPLMELIASNIEGLANKTNQGAGIMEQLHEIAANSLPTLAPINNMLAGIFGIIRRTTEVKRNKDDDIQAKKIFDALFKTNQGGWHLSDKNVQKAQAKNNPEAFAIAQALGAGLNTASGNQKWNK